MSVNFFINGEDVNNYLLTASQIPIVTRGRDHYPSFLGMSLELMYAVPNEPLKGELVLIKLHDLEVYFGFITRINFNYKTYRWEVEVEHYLMSLKKYQINDTLNFAKDTADFTSEKTFTVDTANDYLVCNSHGLVDGDRIQLAATGTLPAPLVADHNYYVKKVDDNNIRLYNNLGHYAIDVAYDSYDNYINITDSGSGTHSFTDDIDLFKYNDWSEFNDMIAFLFDSVDDEIWTASTQNSGGSVKFPIDGYQDSPLDFSVVRFEELSGASMPGGVDEGRFFIAGFNDDDAGWIIYANGASHASNTRFNITSDGRARFSKLAQYRDGQNNLYYPTAIVSIKWLVINLFSLIGVELDTSEIDEVIFHKYEINSVEYEWTWDKIYLMESMLYNINQSEIANISEINKLDQITALELIQDLFMRLGIAIKITDSSSFPLHYKLYSQKRNEDGVIQPDNEDEWTIDNKYKVDYKEDEIIDDQGGYTHERRFVKRMFHTSGVNHFVFEPMSYRYNDEKQSIWYDGSLESRDQVKTNAGNTTIEWLDNLRFFLLDQASADAKVILPSASNPFGQEFYNIANYSAIRNQIYALLNHDREEITFRNAETLFNQGKWNQKEVFYDVRTNRIIIIQEQNQLTSG